MPEQKPSPWAVERFGAAAEALQRAVPEGIHRAHELAIAAHIASTLKWNDAYGGTLKVTQHEQLIAAVKGIPGVAPRKPSGVRSRFELTVVDALSVVLYPCGTPRTASTPEDCEAPAADFRLANGAVHTDCSRSRPSDDP
jgi:hypothetical protein